MKHPREKYLNDKMYRNLVEVMVDKINQCRFTPSEMRETAVLASIIYEERKYPVYSMGMESVDMKGIDISGGSISGVGAVLPPTRFDDLEEHEDNI